MALLSQLLGNRELAWEDQLEKGRIWIYGDGNKQTFLCNGFCWKPPGCGVAVIEIWGPGGSSGKGCCCGTGLPSNAGSYARKTICVCPDNYVFGCPAGRACGNDPLNGRGDSSPTGICWTGCAIHPLYYGGANPTLSYNSWKGNNPWGHGNGETIGNIESKDVLGKHFRPWGDESQALCCAAGATEGCICAQGGQSGYWSCTDGGMNPYECFMRTKWCTRQIHTREICGNYACGLVCGVCSDHSNQYNLRGIRCSFGGDINCCGHFSCTRMLECLDNNPGCKTQYHHPSAPMQYSTEGGVFTYGNDHDTPASRSPGGSIWGLLQSLQTMSRDPSHSTLAWCWSGGVPCGCYEAFGCIPFSPAAIGGYATNTCGQVRDHSGRGGMGMTRIRYIPTDGGTTY